MAAPAAAGIVALMMGEARRLGIDLSIETVREILMTTARHGPPGGSGWDDRYGFGRIDAAEAVASVQRLAGGAPAIASVVGRRGSGKKKGKA